jgi:hypothetical protein
MSITIHFERLTKEVGLFRAYEEGKSYENRDEYFAVVTALWLDDKTIELKGAISKHSTSEAFRLVIKYLKDKGYKLVLDRHHLVNHTWKV